MPLLGRPKAVQIIITIANDRNPRCFKRRILYKNGGVCVQLPKNVSLAKPFCKPSALRLNPRIFLFHTDQTAQMLLFQIVRRKIDEISLHAMSSFPATPIRRRLLYYKNSADKMRLVLCLRAWKGNARFLSRLKTLHHPCHISGKVAHRL